MYNMKYIFIYRHIYLQNLIWRQEKREIRTRESRDKRTANLRS